MYRFIYDKKFFFILKYILKHVLFYFYMSKLVESVILLYQSIFHRNIGPCTSVWNLNTFATSATCLVPNPAHPFPGPPSRGSSPWRRPPATAACPPPSCSTGRTPTPGWRRCAGAGRSSWWYPGPRRGRQPRPPPASGPCPAVPGSAAGLGVIHPSCRRPAGGRTERSCAAAFCPGGRSASARRSGSTPSCAQARCFPMQTGQGCKYINLQRCLISKSAAQLPIRRPLWKMWLIL